jgi:outer membrane protease
MTHCLLVVLAVVSVGLVDRAADAQPAPPAVAPTATGQWPRQPGDPRVDLAAGIGYLRGNVTYAIGGKVNFADGTSEKLHFPVSRLEWPLATTLVWADGTVWFGERWCVSGAVAVNADDGAGRLRDSDWIDARHPAALSIYSESEVTLDYGALDGTLQWWCFPRAGTVARGWRAALDAGLLLQHIAWDATDTEQWYPQQPERGRDFFTDTVNASYKADLCMPYFGGTVQWLGAAYAISAGADLAPWLSFDDEDIHYLRTLVARTAAEGWAWRLRAAVRYRFTGQWFVRLGVVALGLEADGSQATTIRGGRNRYDRWTIRHAIKADQTGGSFVLGAFF